MNFKNILLVISLAAFTFACSDKKTENDGNSNPDTKDSVNTNNTVDSLEQIDDTLSVSATDDFDMTAFLDNDLSYAFGIFIGQPLKDLGLENLVIKEMQASYVDVQKGNELKYSMMEVQTTLRNFFQEVNAKKDISKFDIKKVSYCMGMDIGQKTIGLMNLNPDKLFEGMSDALKGEGKISNEDAKKKIEALNNDIATINGKIEKAFLAWNKSQDGIKTTASGLQYRVIKEGTGAKPTKTSTVKTHYTGTFLNGNIFDSSYKRNEPIEFEVTGVIPGWTEALQLMNPGSKWEIFLPSAIAYGTSPNPTIPPGSTLRFEIELLSFK